MGKLFNKRCKLCTYFESDEDRTDYIKLLTGKASDTCCACNEIVRGDTLSSWDEDGYLWCTNHGLLATRAHCDDHRPKDTE